MEEYMEKIKHINKKDQEYIAKNNRMTEEIIIDGINVAGCVQLVEEPNYPCGLGGECKGWETCYYKQLKRLKQENAELKERLKILDEEEVVYEVTEIEYNNFKKMKQALEEIREMCKKVAFSNGCDNCDGIGFYDGCLDDDCGNYACFKVLNKINEVLNVE